MKNLKKILLSLSVFGLVACNSGSGGGAPTPSPTPDPTPKPLESLPYTYTTNYSTGHTINGLPVIDLLPFGAGAQVTFTFTNPYKESGIWFAQSYLGEFYSTNQSQPLGHNTEIDYVTPPRSSTDCRNYDREHQLPPGQTCTFTQNINGIVNYYNSEDVEIIQGIEYSIDDPKGVDGSRYKYFNVLAYAKTGIWYQDLPNYIPNPISVISFHVLNESGTDYMYQTRRTDMIGKVKMTFDESGVAQVNYANTESCTLNGCSNGVIPTSGYNVYWSYNGAESYTIGNGAYDPYAHVNYELMTLDHTLIGRECSIGSIYCPGSVFSQIFAVQTDGTIVGKNRDGSYGCSNRDGSNYRVITLGEGLSFRNYFKEFYDSIGTSISTITYGHTNWIELYKINPEGTMHSNRYYEVYAKVVADTSGICRLDSENLLYSNSVLDGLSMTVIDNQVQMTPNGIYGWHPTAGLQFYKYLPREYMRN